MPFHHPRTVEGQKETVTIREWFNDCLPHVIVAHHEYTKNLNASLVFKISGEEGGEWTVKLGDDEVLPGAHYPTDFMLEISDKHFEQMLDGRLDAEKAFQSGEIQFNGRLEVLEWFAHVIQIRED
jgi:putative sterol carrier protein